MKKIFSTYWQPQFAGFAIFQIAFFSFMWLSKTVHLLYFEESGSVVLFGISYSAMALAGYFSFFTGHLSDCFGFRRTLVAGTGLYAVGLFLRIFPSSFPIAILSGLIAGLGASTALTALRLWMTSLSCDTTRTQLVGVKSSTMALGTAVGCAMAGLIPLAVGFNLKLTYRDLLLASAIGMAALTLIFLKRSSSENKNDSTSARKPSWQGFVQLFKGTKALALSTSVLGITTGFYVSFISPYLPLLMKEKGLSLAAIGLSTGSFAILRFVIDPWIARFVGAHKQNSLPIYLLAELLIALVTAGFLWPLSKWGFVLLLLLRSGALGFSAISEEVLWLRIFPQDKIGLFFGLNQSAFFLGDFLGGLLNGLLYKSYGLDVSIQVVLAIMLVNATLFFILAKRISNLSESLVLGEAA